MIYLKFTERHHAYISALFYIELEKRKLDNFENVFVFATRKTAEQRGSRMAMRALRDGKELTYQTYRAYGEWAFTDEYIQSLDGKPIITPIDSELDYAYIVHHCPWADAYHELGINMTGGLLYCKDLDASIIRGFNPELEFKIRKNLQDSTECHQYHVNGKASLELEKNPDNIKGFDYQCGHIYKCFSDVMISVYKHEGRKVNESVIKAFGNIFGEGLANVLLSFTSTDFLLV